MKISEMWFWKKVTRNTWMASPMLKQEKPEPVT